VIATWFGCGYAPVGPGTVGSLASVLLAVLLQRIFGPVRWPLMLVTGLLLFPGIWASTKAARYLRTKDPGMVVVDEVLGQWVTLLAVPVLTWKAVAVGFLLFRLFDIWKPWPVRRLERFPDGIGIVADDLAAGAYGALILYIGARLSPLPLWH
jgi:phosphatidylglycerophosphatase A